MQPDPGLEDLLGRTAEERLLEAPPAALPATLARPPAAPEVPARTAIVAAGAAMTGVSLLAGLGLIAWALIASFTDGADLARGLIFLLGLVLAGTHWGWVHVAELTGRSLAERRGRDAVERRQAWLRAVEPYPRLEVVTEVEPDGAIAVVTHVFRPVPLPRERFTFIREELARERLDEETPTAAVAERVEELRHAAAEATADQRDAYLALAGGEDVLALRGADETALLEERRASARALSERLNAHLREPPLE